MLIKLIEALHFKVDVKFMNTTVKFSDEIVGVSTCRFGNRESTSERVVSSKAKLYPAKLLW